MNEYAITILELAPWAVPIVFAAAACFYLFFRDGGPGEVVGVTWLPENRFTYFPGDSFGEARVRENDERLKRIEKKVDRLLSVIAPRPEKEILG